MVSFQDKSVPFFVGTGDKSSQAAISLFDLNLSTGQIVLRKQTPTSIAPGYLNFSPNKKYLYAVTGDQKVNAYQVDKNLGLNFLNSQSSEGANPCHVSVHPSGKMVFVSNYSGGTFSVYGVEENGALTSGIYKEQFLGKGSNKNRQEKAHAHYAAATPNGRFVYVADLGTDRLLNYVVNVNTGELSKNKKQQSFSVKSGSGPRHFVIHPSGKQLFLLNELTSTVTACTVDQDGVIKEVATYESLPKDFTGNNISAAIRIHPNGKFIYVSNRGHNSISAYKLVAGGKLEKVDEIKEHISIPRDFNIDPTGRYMVIGNQDKNQLIVYAVDAKTGKLTFKNEGVSTSEPICIAFY
jgi:6-phosphogluconolactonase